MTDTIKRSRTETYEHTIAGLLTKRADLFNEAERIRDRLAEIKNDVSAMDRVLGTLGYTGNLDAEMPRQKREVLFGRGELTRAIYDEIRTATGPLTTRQIAEAILVLQGHDARDRKMMREHTIRVSKALRSLREGGSVKAGKDAAGTIVWGVGGSDLPI